MLATNLSGFMVYVGQCQLGPARFVDMDVLESIGLEILINHVCGSAPGTGTVNNDHLVGHEVLMRILDIRDLIARGKIGRAANVSAGELFRTARVNDHSTS